MSHAKLDKIIREFFLVSDKPKYNDAEISWICNSAQQIFLQEPTVLQLEAPIHICGDIHGQFHDLLRVFQSVGTPPNTTFLFLGDYVDRGKQSIEVINLLLALKFRYPKHIYLLRGNHECTELAEAFGFAAECAEKINKTILSVYNEVFETMPLAAVIGGKVFCVHGGISPVLPHISDIKKIRRPTMIPDSGPIADLLWSDPSPSTPNGEWGPNQRGTTYTWGHKAATKFLSENNLEMIIRAHQVAFDGYSLPFSGDTKVVTLFTASSYAGEYKNKAAFISIAKLNPLQPESSTDSLVDSSEGLLQHSQSHKEKKSQKIRKCVVDDMCIKFNVLTSAMPLPAQILNENFSPQQVVVKKKKLQPRDGRT